MRILSIEFAIMMLGLVILSYEGAFAQSSKRKRHAHSHGHRHSHSHGHDHDHDHSPFSFGLGLTVSSSLGSQGSAEGGESGGSHEGHNHLRGKRSLGLHGDHAGGESESGEGGSSSGAAAELSLMAGYQLNKSWKLNLGLGFAPETGLADPTGGIGHTLPLSKQTSLATSLSASAPLSKASQDSYKITTITLTSGPTFKRKRWTFGLKGKFAKTYYSKTVVAEEEEEEAHNLTLSGLGLQEEEDHDHEVETAEGITGEREFDRYGGATTANYRFNKRWNIGTGFGVDYVTRQFADPLVEATATIIQAGFSWKSFSATAGVTTSSSDASFTLPTTPGVSAGVFYLYE